MSGSDPPFGHERCVLSSSSVSGTLDLEGWYRSHGEAVHRRGRRLLGSDDAAWDLVQETFLRARRYGSSYRGGSPLSWLLTIADRVAYDVLKKRKELTPLEDVEVFLADEAGDRTEPAARLRLVRTLLGRTDERTALMVVRRYFDEMDLQSIAAELDVNERTVRRALEKFLEDARQFATKAGGVHA